MNSSELMMMMMGRLFLASEVETEQSDSSAMSLGAIHMSSVVDRSFASSRFTSFSLRMVQSAMSISSPFVFACHQK